MQQLQGQTPARLQALVLLRTINVRCMLVIDRPCGLHRHWCRRIQTVSPFKGNTGCWTLSIAAGSHGRRAAFPIHFRYGVDISPREWRYQRRFASRKQCGRQDQRRHNQRVFHTEYWLPWACQPDDRIPKAPRLMFDSAHNVPEKVSLVEPCGFVRTPHFTRNKNGPVRGRCYCWRRGWDSNPRYACAYSGFRDRYIQPLCHLS